MSVPKVFYGATSGVEGPLPCHAAADSHELPDFGKGMGFEKPRVPLLANKHRGL
jgi:hypothetical protein